MIGYIIAAVIVFLIVLYVIVTYNSLVTLRNKVKDEWSQIDVELKRRFDLIPNLVNTVKGYAKYEKSTLDEIVKSRNTYLTADTKEGAMAANNELTNAVSKLFALAEDYPELKANENFLDLQNQLTETENKITFARKFYNDNVFLLNNKIDKFPSNLVAKLFKFTKYDFFSASEQQRENVKVEF